MSNRVKDTTTYWHSRKLLEQLAKGNGSFLAGSYLLEGLFSYD